MAAIRWWLVVLFALAASLALVRTVPAFNHRYTYVWIYIGTCSTCAAVSLAGFIIGRYRRVAFWAAIALQAPMGILYLLALRSIPGSDDACGMLWIALVGTGMLISGLIAVAAAGHTILRAERVKDRSGPHGKRARETRD